MNKIALKALIIFSFFRFTTSAVGQSTQTCNPYIINFDKSVYSGGTENWDVHATNDGYVYIANNEGLLVFNGKIWKRYSLPNNTIVRSIAVDEKNEKIYTGGQDEIGFFQKGKDGALAYTSLKPKMAKGYSSFEDVWDMQLMDGCLYFRTMQQVFKFDGQKIVKISSSDLQINLLRCSQGKIYLSNTQNGLYLIDNNKINFIPGSSIFKNMRISDLLFDRSEIIVITEKNGLYIQRNQQFKLFHKSDFVSKALLTSGIKTNDGLIFLGSVLKGVLVLNDEGKFLYSLDKKQGLQNNNVIAIATDLNQNLWAGTSNGIDQVLINSPYSIMYPDLDLEGSIYGVRIYNNRLYAGTNNGLYYTDWNTNKEKTKLQQFKKVKNSDGQVWALDVINGDLFMCHNEGLFQIENEQALKLSKDLVGAWRCISTDNPTSFITGTYKGFQLYKKVNNKWTFQKYLEGFTESARIIDKDKRNNIWVSHPYRGVYRLTINYDKQKIQSVKLFGQKEGLYGTLTNYVTTLNDNIYVTSNDGLYQFDTLTEKFTKEIELSTLLDNQINTRRLFQNQEAFIWYVKEAETGLLYIKDSPTSKSTTRYLTSFLNDKLIGGFENIYSITPDETFICTDKGLILMNVESFFKAQQTTVRINKVSVLNEEHEIVVSEGIANSNQPPYLLESKQNTLFFSMGSNQLDPTMPVQFSSILEGSEKEWTNWTYETERSFHSLKPGKYALKVKAKSSNGSITPEVKYTFVISKPFYLTNIFLFCYVLIFISAIWSLIKYLDKKHENEKQQLISDIEATEAKVESLEEEKLQAAIDFKNKELALSTMHIVQKNEVLSKVRQELDYTIIHTSEPGTKSRLKNIIHILSDDQRLEEDWESFALHFDQVHTDFLRRIKEKFPQLSNKDLKLCAYLRMNLTTKEIAPLLNISFRGVEISRYRLRKKMKLSSEINLNDFMIQF